MTEEQRWPEPVYLTKDHAINMTLRDYAAIKAMQGMLANPKLQEQILRAGQSWIEESAWKVADAMLKAREKK
jgi:hypothetical protein